MAENTPVRPKNDLTRVSTLADADILIVDGADGVRGITHADYEAQLGGAPSSDNPTNANLKEIVSAEGYEPTSITYGDNGVIESATVLWPDGSVGVYTTTTKNAAFSAVDAFTITHADSGKTVTQPAVTRNSSGAVTVKPALTVS